MSRFNIPRIEITAASSGSGKTTFTCALLYYLKSKGKKTAAFKCGPDYIDPMFHKVISGVECVNLDTYFLRDSRNDINRLVADYGAGMDIAVIEGVMGIYDGKSGGEDISSYRVAQLTDTPVILLVNSKGSSITSLAIAEGIMSYYGEGRIKGVIFNNMSSKVYSQVRDEYMRRHDDFLLLGHIPVLPKEFTIESRHLGLLTPDNAGKVREKVKGIYNIIKNTVEWDRIDEISRHVPELDIEDTDEARREEINTGADRPVIAVARDEAFCFYYEENIRELVHAGADIRYFSPLADEPVPDEACGLYLGGGYPECYAGKLEGNMITKQSVREALKKHMPVIAECGGYMYLTESIDDHDMCGILAGDTYNTGHLVRFGYVTLKAAEDNVLLSKDETIRGHEFHYYDNEHCGHDFEAMNLKGTKYSCGIGNDWMYAGYPHIYLASCQTAGRRFVEKCRKYRNEEMYGTVQHN